MKEDVYEGLAVWADGYNKPHCLTWTSCLTSRSAFKRLGWALLTLQHRPNTLVLIKKYKASPFDLLFSLHTDDAMFFLWKKRKENSYFDSYPAVITNKGVILGRCDFTDIGLHKSRHLDMDTRPC